jgi:hypothetical protein
MGGLKQQTEKRSNQHLACTCPMKKSKVTVNDEIDYFSLFFGAEGFELLATIYIKSSY